MFFSLFLHLMLARAQLISEYVIVASVILFLISLSFSCSSLMAGSILLIFSGGRTYRKGIWWCSMRFAKCSHTVASLMLLRCAI